MMTPAEMALARDLARHPEFPRPPRSLYLDDAGHPWTHVGAGIYVDGAMQVVIDPTVALIPDLSDPATWGALFARLPPERDIVSNGRRVLVYVFIGANTAGGFGTTWGEAVAKVWLATRGGGR